MKRATASSQPERICPWWRDRCSDAVTHRDGWRPIRCCRARNVRWSPRWHITPPVASLNELEVLRKSAETQMMELTTKVAVRNWERTRMHQSVDTTEQHPALMVRTGWFHTVDHHGNPRVCYCTRTPEGNVRSTRSQQHQRGYSAPRRMPTTPS